MTRRSRSSDAWTSQRGTLNRRGFLTALAALPAAVRGGHAQSARFPIIDSHIHMFDRNKPGGSFYPRTADPVLGDSALPARFRPLAAAHNIVGAIVVEASPWLEENQWILDQSQADSIIVGHIGFLSPGVPGFAANLGRFAKNRLFRGIRYGNRENRPGGNVRDAIETTTFVDDLERLSDAGLSLELNPVQSAGDTSGNDARTLLRVRDRVPSLPLIVPHLARFQPPRERQADHLAALRELGQRPSVWMKLSGIVRKVDGQTVTDLTRYKDWLDQLWDAFGEDRVIFGSDWPNSLQSGSFDDVMKVARAYVDAKGPRAAEKVYWRNSVAAYRWVKRADDQPQA